MTDNRVLTEQPTPVGTSGSRRIRPLLWIVLVVVLAGDVVISSKHLSPFVDVPVGLLGLACIIGLVVDHYKHRR
jgi:hypothetical protein